jgi:hypothetical protein
LAAFESEPVGFGHWLHRLTAPLGGAQIESEASGLEAFGTPVIVSLSVA